MIVARVTDASFINRVVNHPDVKPFVHAPQDRELDLSGAVANPNNVMLQGEFGGMLMIQHLPGVVELHTMVLPEGRGAWALKMARQCMEYLFCRTSAYEVFTRVPEGNVAAAALTRACGAKLEHTVTQWFHGKPVNVGIWGGRIQDWIRIAPGLEELGREFHARLHTKAHQAGLDIDHHESDAWHDRHVGAAAAMILGGQPLKGLNTFNRWAAFAIAPPMRLLSMDPLIFHITHCLLKVTGQDFEVLPCPQE